MHRKTRLARTSKLISLALLACAGASVAEAGPSQRIVVTYKSGPTAAGASVASVDAVAAVSKTYGVSLSTVRDAAGGARIYRLDKALTNAELDRLVASLNADPTVEHAEKDVLMKSFLVPNDPLFNEQWHYHEPAGGIDLTGMFDILPPARAGLKTIVAMIDSGYRPHADLARTFLPGYDMISDLFVAADGNGRDVDAKDPGDYSAPDECEPGYPGDASDWHGTKTSGIVAATTNNGVGIASVAPAARLVPVRVEGRCGAPMTDVADGITWATGGTVPGVPANPNPARVVNISLGAGGACPGYLKAAIDGAVARRAILVTASGNTNEDAANFFPVNCGGTLPIGATDRTGAKTWYSNYGSSIVVGAPGGDPRPGPADLMITTSNSGTVTPVADAYQYAAGTSLSAPVVAGVVALMLSVNPKLSIAGVRSILESTARPYVVPCTDCGAGIVDAKKAVEAAMLAPASE